MINIKKIAIILPLFLFLASPVRAGEISGNGTQSVNKIKYKNTVSILNTQVNYSKQINNAGVLSVAGQNKANKNVGAVTVTSGDSITSVLLENTANVNTQEGAQTCNCGCTFPTEGAVISGNGANSLNKIKYVNDCSNVLVQENTSVIVNNVQVETVSGGNSGNSNTGGPVEVNSGNSEVTVSITNTANANSSL